MNALLDRLGIEGPKSSFEARLANLTKASGRKFPNTQPEPKVEGSLPLIRGFWLKNALQESSSLMTTSDTGAIKIHRKSAATDAIDDTLDYKAVAKRLIAFVGESEYQLVETLADKITEIVLSEFSVPWVKLTVRKPGAVRGSRDVGVIIERGSRE